MKTKRVLICFLSLLIFSTANSDVLMIQRLQSSQKLDLPLKGTTMNKVESTYGKALSIKGPIGDPPITTWEYENFSVYFEYQHVIHTVAHKATPEELGPKPIE